MTIESLASAESDLRQAPRFAGQALNSPVLTGLHPLEPDFAERGVWVERRVRIPLPASVGGDVTLTGLYFPKLIAAQHGSAEAQVDFFVGRRQVHRTKLHRHGAFKAHFVLDPSLLCDAGAELSITCDRGFVPAQIDDSNDQRELCWRLKSLTVGSTHLFDCSRQLNFLIFPNAGEPEPLSLGLRFHLDAPRVGAGDSVEGRFIASGWACHLTPLRAVAVRLVLGQQSFAATSVARQDVQLAFADNGPLPLETGFSVTLQPLVGIVPIRVEVQLAPGLWSMQQQGYVLSAPPQRRLPGGKMGHWLTNALPQAVISRTLDHLRVALGEKNAASLPKSFRFHLDNPQVERLNVISTECIVSGWVFDEEAFSTVPVRVVGGGRVHPAHAKQREDVQRAFQSLGSIPLSTGFACVVSLPFGLHRVQVEVRTADGEWIPVRRVRLMRVPGIGKRHRAAPQRTLLAYLRAEQKLQALELPEVQRHIQVMLDRPRFLVLIDNPVFDAALRSTLASIRDQVYPLHAIQIRTPRPPKAIPAWEAAAAVVPEFSVTDDGADFVVFLRAGERLAPRALYAFAAAVNQEPTVDLIYGDELIGQGRRRPPLPFYKPDWSPDYLETFNYIGFAACFRANLVRDCIERGAPIHGYDLTLRITERTRNILHLPQFLGDRLSSAGADPAAPERDSVALSARLARTGRDGSVQEHPMHKGCYAVTLRLRRTPLVSIVIPTAAKTIALDGREIDLLANVIEQILGRSTYRNIEIVIVDNGDLSPAQLALLQRHGCKRVTYTQPVFNISKKLNLGVTLAKGELLLLMNDDIEILTPDWIERMVEHFEKSHVGVVGGKLLYLDGRTQHVGVVHNNGNPDHVRRLFPRDEAGYFYSTCGVRNFGAVTGACMMTIATVYREVGGYSEELAVSYNDADFCLKVGQRGLSIVYAPAVELTHMESQSRVASADPDEVAWYHTRWAAEVVSDRFYNERFLTVASPTFIPFINERLV